MPWLSLAGPARAEARDRGEYMGFRFTQDGEVIYVPEEIKARFKDEVDAIISEAREAAAISGEDDSARESRPEREEPRARDRDSEPAGESSPPPLRIQMEEEEPQTQMAAAFAALKLDQLASDTPPEETKAARIRFPPEGPLR